MPSRNSTTPEHYRAKPVIVMPIPTLQHPPLNGTTVLLLVGIAMLVIALQRTVVRRFIKAILSPAADQPGRNAQSAGLSALSAPPAVHVVAPAAPDREAASSTPSVPPPA